MVGPKSSQVKIFLYPWGRTIDSSEFLPNNTPARRSFLPSPHPPTPHFKPQNIAKMLGGLATPPGTLQGSLATKKLHLPSARHATARASSQKSSPMGHP